MSNINWDPIINAAITLVATIISIVVIPKVKKLLNEKLTKEQRENLKSMVAIAVKAAEQIYGSKTGQQKKEHVYDYLVSKGIQFDFDEVAEMIESEVYKISSNVFTTEEVNSDIIDGYYAVEDAMNIFAEEELFNGKGEDEEE